MRMQRRLSVSDRSGCAWSVANQRWVTAVGRSGPPLLHSSTEEPLFNQSAADGAPGNRVPSSGPVPSCQTMIRGLSPPDLITSITQEAEEHSI